MVRKSLMVFDHKILSQYLDCTIYKMCSSIADKNQGAIESCYYVSYINLATTYLVQNLNGSTSTHFVRYLTAVIIYFAPVLLPLLRNGPTNSIAHISKGSSRITKCSSIWCFSKGRPVLWHISHFVHIIDSCGTMLTTRVLFWHFSCSRFSLIVSFDSPFVCFDNDCFSSCSKAHLRSTSLIPSLSNSAFISVYSVAFMGSAFFFLSDNSSGIFLVCKNSAFQPILMELLQFWIDVRLEGHHPYRLVPLETLVGIDGWD